MAQCISITFFAIYGGQVCHVVSIVFVPLGVVPGPDLILNSHCKCPVELPYMAISCGWIAFIGHFVYIVHSSLIPQRTRQLPAGFTLVSNWVVKTTVHSRSTLNFGLSCLAHKMFQLSSSSIWESNTQFMKVF